MPFAARAIFSVALTYATRTFQSLAKAATRSIVLDINPSLRLSFCLERPIMVSVNTLFAFHVDNVPNFKEDGFGPVRGLNVCHSFDFKPFSHLLRLRRMSKVSFFEPLSDSLESTPTHHSRSAQGLRHNRQILDQVRAAK